MAATFGLAAVLVVQTRANADLKSANFDLALANPCTGEANRELETANQRERARFDLALEAIKTFHGGVSEDVLLKERQFDGLRTKLLLAPRNSTSGWRISSKGRPTDGRARRLLRRTMTSAN